MPQWVIKKDGNSYYFYKDYGQTLAGSLSDEGDLLIYGGISGTDKAINKPELIDKPIQAARYIFLKTQKTNESESVKENQEPLIKVGHRRVYPNIDNWVAYRKSIGVIRIIDNRGVSRGLLVGGYPNLNDISVYYEGSPGGIP